MPSISISTPDFTIFCNSTIEARLFALESEDIASYQWLRDGIPDGTNSSTFLAQGVGAFSVEAITVDGCIISSNPISLLEDCSGGGGQGGGSFPNCPSGVSPAIAITPTPLCNERTYESISSGMVSGTASWFFDDPGSGGDNNADLDRPTHRFSRAGYYRIVVIAEYTDGVTTGRCFAYQADTIPVAADFEAIPACAGSGMLFQDLSTKLPGQQIISWSWDFGDPASGPANTSDLAEPTHVYELAGTYVATLTIEAATGCTAQFSKEVEVLASPTLNIAHPDLICEEEAAAYELLNAAEFDQLQWQFNARDTVEGERAYYSYEEPGSYDGVLLAISREGCMVQATFVQEVTANGLSGSIVADFADL